MVVREGIFTRLYVLFLVLAVFCAGNGLAEASGFVTDRLQGLPRHLMDLPAGSSLPAWHPSRLRKARPSALHHHVKEATPPIESAPPAESTASPGEIMAKKASAGPFVGRGLPKCHLHIHRHVSKAAGTTLRFIFDKQVMMGDWEFLPMCHYGFSCSIVPGLY
eukprot:CAMPEP_0118946214 /NCGR_PEP_ID=MMETSP1169-20130426/43816_2 /TAXON_ID=36882 /ORGANISM="Pyramimonas obovata, Strain CCMP722" /LENGTH=162 /DNA_ID=CAMNT_0006892129 /DNA_START=55 /DNA_END=540 /DNA_ORIENTATION=-